MLKIIKLPEVIKMTALSRSSIYAFINQNSFPKPIRLGKRAVGWNEHEIMEWIKQRAEARIA